MADDVARRIEERLRRRGVRASAEQINSTTRFIGHLAKWNDTINLTALDLADGLDESLDRLVVEPFLAARALRESIPESFKPSSTLRLLDLGSGGGSPGIPLAIALQAGALTMVESKERKASFLRDVLRELGWTNSAVIQARTNELWSGGIDRHSVDVISIRALSMSPADWRGAASLLALGGRILWFRSASQAEASTAPLTGEKTANLDDDGGQVRILKLEN